MNSSEENSEGFFGEGERHEEEVGDDFFGDGDNINEGVGNTLRRKKKTQSEKEGVNAKKNTKRNTKNQKGDVKVFFTAQQEGWDTGMSELLVQTHLKSDEYDGILLNVQKDVKAKRIQGSTKHLREFNIRWGGHLGSPLIYFTPCYNPEIPIQFTLEVIEESDFKVQKSSEILNAVFQAMDNLPVPAEAIPFLCGIKAAGQLALAIASLVDNDKEIMFFPIILSKADGCTNNVPLSLGTYIIVGNHETLDSEQIAKDYVFDFSELKVVKKGGEHQVSNENNGEEGGGSGVANEKERDDGEEESLKKKEELDTVYCVFEVTDKNWKKYEDFKSHAQAAEVIQRKDWNEILELVKQSSANIANAAGTQ